MGMSKNQGSKGSSSSMEAELARLKIANAQLLAAAADTGSKTEKRIRAAVAAHASSCETELFLERELRETAEKSCEDLQMQLNDVRQKMKIGTRENILSPAREVLNKSKADQSSLDELDKLKDELHALSLNCKEKEERNKELETAQSTIATYKEKCEKLSAESREVNRGMMFE